MLLPLALVFDALLALVLWRMVRQFRGYDAIGPEAAEFDGAWPQVAVIVPARNEAVLIGRCLRGLLAQDYPFLRLLLVDDNSEDGTGEIARALAGDDSRFTLIRGAPLPPGWTGKPFACWQGAAAAAGAEFLCFMDADTVAEPALLRAAVAEAERRGLDMLSLEPFQELGSLPERLVVPCGFYLIAATQDLGRVNDPDAPEAVANGQFLLFRRAAYEAVGGHATVKAEFSEDTALARRIKQAGLRLGVLGAESLIRTRMYQGWRSVWNGVAKNAVDIAGGVVPTLMIAAGGLVLTLAALGLLAFAILRLLHGASGLDIAGVVLALAGLASVIGLHVAGARHFRIPLAYGLTFPLGYAFAFALAVNSVRVALRGRVPWKNRVYAQSQSGIEALQRPGPQG